MKAKISAFRRGMILLWSGSIAAIPKGWALCNGSNGTPDLRNRFIVGAGSTYAVDETGGTTSHGHGMENLDHSHLLNSGDNVAAGSGWSIQTTEDSGDAAATSEITLPPYYALAYIMKT